jgi:hypothetical protein
MKGWKAWMSRRDELTAATMGYRSNWRRAAASRAFERAHAGRVGPVNVRV